jgi:transposase
MSTKKRKSEKTGRAQMRLPGRPTTTRKEHRRRFWIEIAAGLSSEEAARIVGVAPAGGSRWFRQAGGMPHTHLAPSSAPSSGRYLFFTEREAIALLRAQGHGVREVARRIGRAASTVSRELRRNAATRGGGFVYRAATAQWHADRAARRPRPSKLATNARLRGYVQDRLGGVVAASNGETAPGAAVSWRGRRHGRRKPRRWARAWSPEQIAHRLPLDFPDDPAMRISHEAIYQALYVDGPGGLDRDMTTCLRSRRPLRVPRARARGRGKSRSSSFPTARPRACSATTRLG